MTVEVRQSKANLVLAEIGVALASSLRLDEALPGVLRVLTDDLADLADLALIARVDDDGKLDPALLVQAAAEDAREVVAGVRDVILEQIRETAESRRPFLIRNDPPGTVPAAAEGVHQALLAQGWDSAIVAPIASDRRVFGVLVLARLRVRGAPDGEVDPRKRASLDEQDESLVTEVGRRIGAGLETARLYADLEAARRTQAFLLGVARVLAAATSYEETLGELARVALPTLGDLCLIDLIDDEGALRRMVAYHHDPQCDATVKELLEGYPPLLDGPHPSARAIVTKTSQWSNEMSDEFLRATTRNERHFELAKQLEFTSYIAVPLVVESETLGAVILVSTGSGRLLDREDVALAETLARQVAIVVRKARSYQRERDTSEVLQSRLLPRELPVVRGARFGVAYLPRMAGIEACGDFYDVVDISDDIVWLMVGDVAGHDRQAAAQMGHLRVAARLLSGQVRRPATMVRWLRRSWERIEMDRMATAVFCKVDVKSGDIDIASAGHPAPVIVRPGEAAFLPVRPSPPLGGPRSRTYEWHGKLAYNEALLLYTDGVLQDRDRRLSVDEAMEQLISVVSACPPDPDELCRRVQTALGSDRSDDVALLSFARSRS